MNSMPMGTMFCIRGRVRLGKLKRSLLNRKKGNFEIGRGEISNPKSRNLKLDCLSWRGQSNFRFRDFGFEPFVQFRNSYSQLTSIFRTFLFMDVAACLDRIQFDGQLRADESTLRNLQRAFLLAVPFENLDVHL